MKNVNGCVLIPIEEYNELLLKAWKYDKLREKEMSKNYYFSSVSELDIFEPTDEELKAIEERGNKNETV